MKTKLYEYQNKIDYKQIKNFPNYYIFNDGRVFSNNKHEFMIPKKHYKGYLCVTLSKQGKTKTFKIHRLVAQAFIPNPNNLPQVNHINGIKTDNNVNNLEWCTNSENQKHAYDVGLRKHYKGINCPLYKRPVLHGKTIKPIKVIINGFEKKYCSINEAARDLQMLSKYIGQVVNGKRKNYKGYVFKEVKTHTYEN